MKKGRDCARSIAAGRSGISGPIRAGMANRRPLERHWRFVCPLRMPTDNSHGTRPTFTRGGCTPSVAGAAHDRSRPVHSSTERKLHPFRSGSHSSGHNAQAVRLRRLTLYRMSYRREHYAHQAETPFDREARFSTRQVPSIDPPLTLVWRDARRRSPAVDAFLRHLIEAAAKEHESPAVVPKSRRRPAAQTPAA